MYNASLINALLVLLCNVLFRPQLKGMSGEAAEEEVKVMVEKLKLEDKKNAVVSRMSDLHLCVVRQWKQLGDIS